MQNVGQAYAYVGQETSGPNLCFTIHIGLKFFLKACSFMGLETFDQPSYVRQGVKSFAHF